MKQLNFSYNWNDKLHCKSFTTIRLSNVYDIGDNVIITLKNKELFIVTVIGKKKIKLDSINDWMAYLDTGYDAIECKKLLQTMYKNKNINWETQDLYYYLLKKKQ